MQLSEVGELGLLAELERRGLAQRIENDAAELGDGRIVTQDALVEDVHFRLDWISWRDLGYRAAAVNISDLSASGAEPEGLIVSVGLPGDSALDDVIELYEGIREAGVPVLGGDTTAAERVYLSLTALGRSERVPGRGGAKPGDLIVVTGPLGGAGAAFREQRFLRPPIRTEEGRDLARTAHAMLDVSDWSRTSATSPLARGFAAWWSSNGCLSAREPRSRTSASARTTSSSPPCRPRCSTRSAAARRARGLRYSVTGFPSSWVAGSTSRSTCS